MNKTAVFAASILAFVAAGALAGPAAGADLVLDREGLRALAAAGTPSEISPLRGVRQGDPARAPGDAALRDALHDPDEVWRVAHETLLVSESEIAVRGGKAWVVSLGPDGLHIEGPLEAPDTAAFVAARLRFPGEETGLQAAAELGDPELAVLAALDQCAARPAPLSVLADGAGRTTGLSAAQCRTALETLQQFGWLRLAATTPEPAWEVLQPAAVAALAHPVESIRISRCARAGRPTAEAVFCSAAGGTLVRVGSSVSGLPAPRARSAEEILRRLGALTRALQPPPDSAASAPPAPGAAAARTTPIGEEVLAELQTGVFRLSHATATRDAFGRGQVDTWRIDRLAEYQDTTGTGAIDFVKIDDFGAGRWSRSFILVDGKWQSSNIVDVFLEIEFKLPWDRSAYHPHNVQVLLNGKEVARMEDVVPEGYHRFPLRPQDVRLPTQAGARNEVRLVTTHLRGGHYVVSTAFNLCFQLAEVTRYVIAENEKDAARILAESGNLVSGGVDAALYSNEWTVSNDRPKDGEPVKVRGLARNLGGAPIRKAALILKEGDKVLARGEIAEIPAADLVPAEMEFAPGPGEHRWTLSLEADGDARAGNHAVPLVIRCGGDDVKPSLEISAPAEGSEIAAGAVTLSGAASDNVAIGVLEFSVDGGLWTAVAPGARWETPVTLAAGKHRIRVRCTDSSGNAAEVIRIVTAK